MIGVVTDYDQGNKVGIVMPDAVSFLQEECSGNLRKKLDSGELGMHVTFTIEDGMAVGLRLTGLSSSVNLETVVRESGNISDYHAENQAGLVRVASGTSLGFLREDCSSKIQAQLDNGNLGIAVTFARVGRMAKAIR